ncbi:Methyltransferase NNMT/PNMT/TEMT [Gracilaria domingensis]|nr:Methyltransferase NNMT/PNMT/TEMT [Gracilaria domingensis]
MQPNFSSYEESFDSSAYLQKSYSSPKRSSETFEAEARQFVMKHIADFYKTHGTTFNGEAKLLEFGGGPVIAYIISAVKHVSDIVFSDYCSSGREAVRSWKEKEAGAHDWTPFFEYVIRELEEDPTPDAVVTRMEEMRAKISSIVHCDATLTNPIGDEFKAKFDIISVSFCFESACRNHEDLVFALRQLKKLLSPGGWIRVNGVYGGSYYLTNGKKFFNLTQTEESLRTAFQASGFVCKTWSLFLNRKAVSNADYRGMYHATAQTI